MKLVIAILVLVVGCAAQSADKVYIAVSSDCVHCKPLEYRLYANPDKKYVLLDVHGQTEQVRQKFGYLPTSVPAFAFERSGSRERVVVGAMSFDTLSQQMVSPSQPLRFVQPPQPLRFVQPPQPARFVQTNNEPIYGSGWPGDLREHMARTHGVQTTGMPRGAVIAAHNRVHSGVSRSSGVSQRDIFGFRRR